MKKLTFSLSLFMALTLIITSCGEASSEKTIEPSNKGLDSATAPLDTNKAAISSPAAIIPTIKIGDQDWMKEDIKKIVYNNGDPIPEAKTEKTWVKYGSKKEGCFRKLRNGSIVYNGFVLSDSRGIVPDGFRIPTCSQFEQLIKSLGGGQSLDGKATRAMASYSIFVEDWVGDQETGGLETVEKKSNGSSGFNAKEGGFVYDHGALGNEGSCSFWWTCSKEGNSNFVIDIGFCSQDLGGGKYSYPLTYGFALRAIKK